MVTDTLKAAHQALRRAIPGARRKAAQSEGRLAAAFREAMKVWDAQKADGVPFAERLCGLDALLRQVWPQTRPWKYLCQNCDDLGLVMATCQGDATCGRSKPHLPHTFGTPCWCDRGPRFREKQRPTADDFTQAGRTKPTRIGQR